jgi:molecular chaperone GrpE (heat shock protein)
MTKDKETKEIDLSANLKKLTDIADWFDSQDEVDVEKGLTKVKEASELIKESKERLTKIQNEFEEIKKVISEDLEGDSDPEQEPGINW